MLTNKLNPRSACTDETAKQTYHQMLENMTDHAASVAAALLNLITDISGPSPTTDRPAAAGKPSTLKQALDTYPNETREHLNECEFIIRKIREELRL